jgi:hypothetical protein
MAIRIELEFPSATVSQGLREIAPDLGLHIPKKGLNPQELLLHFRDVRKKFEISAKIKSLTPETSSLVLDGADDELVTNKLKIIASSLPRHLAGKRLMIFDDIPRHLQNLIDAKLSYRDILKRLEQLHSDKPSKLVGARKIISEKAMQMFVHGGLSVLTGVVCSVFAIFANHIHSAKAAYVGAGILIYGLVQICRGAQLLYQSKNSSRDRSLGSVSRPRSSSRTV